MGPVSLRLGYLKTLCNLNTAYVDLKRIPGEGEVFKLGAVHFVPADPALYSPFYQHPAELNNAFDLIAQKFKEFEARHRRRSSVLNTVISERMSSQASVQDLKEALMKAQHEFVDSVEEPPARPEIPKGEAPAPMMTSLTSRLSMLPKNLGALLGTAGGPPASMEQIQREMEAARVKANEEARRLELEEEQLMLAQQREREARALREEYERNAKEKIARMVKGEREPVPVPAAAISQEEYVDEVDDVYENAEVEQEQIIEMEDLDQDVYEAAESNVQYADNSVVEAAEPVIERPFSFNESVAEKPTYSSYAEREIDLGDDAVVAAEETYVQSVVVNAVSVADVYDAPVESDVNILKDAEEAREDEDDTPYIESVVSNAVSYENTYVAPVDDELFGSEEIEQTAGVASEEMEETAVVVAEETEQTTILDEPADEFAEVQTREILQETTYTEDVDAEQATSTEVPAYMADEQVLDDVDEPESHEETNEVAVQDVIYAEELSAESVEEPVHIDEAADVEVADVEAAHVEVVDEAIADDEPVADAADDIADDEPVADAADDIADDEPVADAADEELANYDELVVERAESSEEVIEQAYQSVEETVSAEFEEPLQEREVLTVVPTGEFAAAIEAEFENNEVDEPVYDIDEGVVESNFAEVVEGETMEPVYEKQLILPTNHWKSLMLTYLKPMTRWTQLLSLLMYSS
ncbi:hypothetical protein BCR33DRAFT_35339 [Rhizoclosmatium globosum]|uniref:Uncharacterized protein n=1 Tax=Rhizoclosmatium globosum TaxID=329046 RepID=A0A1Y2CN97_9FUNG|nr:hypothetical protein BCR33DRAFT_35339 [Rhizoclosmatium globosum]|eukprot:ORY48437.1 hypothetical protein BCR33DRAFT_35339 [Rhizoclosmatium globosum]